MNAVLHILGTFSSYHGVKIPLQTPIKISTPIASLKRLQTQLADQPQRAAVHRVQIRQLRERSRDEREGDSSGRRQAIQITTYPDSRRSAGCAVRNRYSARPSILLRSLAAMAIDLTARELSDILEGLDKAIECMADWSDDEFNTARDRRDIRRKTRKFRRLAKKLIVYAPNHYMAISVTGASRGSGATVTLIGTELGSNGEKPVATKPTNNGAGTVPPVTCPEPPLKGGRRGASGGSRNGVKARSIRNFHPAVPKESATLDIANHPFGAGSFLRFFPAARSQAAAITPPAACRHDAFTMKPTLHPKPFQSQLWPYLNEIRRLRKERATWPAIAAELGQRGVTLDPWTIRRFFKRAQSGKVPLGFEEPQYPLPVIPGGKLPPIGKGRDPLLEVSPELTPWTPVGREEDIVDEARRRMRAEYSSKPTIVKPGRLL